MESQRKCKKLLYKTFSDDRSPCVLLGLVVREDDDFLTFRTAKKEYKIAKSVIVSIEDTDIEFREGGV